MEKLDLHMRPVWTLSFQAVNFRGSYKVVDSESFNFYVLGFWASEQSTFGFVPLVGLAQLGFPKPQILLCRLIQDLNGQYDYRLIIHPSIHPSIHLSAWVCAHTPIKYTILYLITSF